MRVSMAIKWCEDLHVWEPGNWLTFTGGVMEHSSDVIYQSCWETGTSIEKQSARETVKEIVNARERWEGEHSSLTGSHSHRTAHFLSASRRRKKTARRRRKRALDSDAKPLLFLQLCSRAVFCGKEKIRCERIWIAGVTIQAWRERKGWKRILENF